MSFKPFLNPEIEILHSFVRNAQRSGNLVLIGPDCGAARKLARRLWIAFHWRLNGRHKSHLVIATRRYRLVTTMRDGRRWLALKDCTAEQFRRVTEYEWTRAANAAGGPKPATNPNAYRFNSYMDGKEEDNT